MDRDANSVNPHVRCTFCYSLVPAETSLTELGDLRGGAFPFAVLPERLGQQLAALGCPSRLGPICQPFVDDVGGPPDGVGAESDGLRELACSSGGAGENRTPVRQADTGLATTIPESAACGCRYAGSCGSEDPAAGSFSGVSGLCRLSAGLSLPSTAASGARLQRSGPACHCWSR